ncbi:helix-turn-helix transcriptional regulator [Lysinibacillus fusiformis]|uniref:helix-turn-helix transcriptional regulator n=1 Tax=Lysinibacillus fusiformis TaxID=28031 RepID=UPI001880F2D3|nr:helix-turn-helix transcriptional regulator [Lysinibacillus fusiformis]MBD8522315.1 helix-turn-helix transcriptional regulator [Lysinibacillus fusiformis]
MRKVLAIKRIDAGYTRMEVASNLGLSEIFVRKLEEGGRNPSIKTMLKFQKLYDEPIEKLFPDIFHKK